MTDEDYTLNLELESVSSILDQLLHRFAEEYDLRCHCDAKQLRNAAGDCYEQRGVLKSNQTIW